MSEEDVEQSILRDLALPALRSSFVSGRASKDQLYLGPYGFRYYWQNPESEIDANVRQEAKALVRSSSIIVRMLELALDGIWPSIKPDGDRGCAFLSIVVWLSPRGRRVLEGKAFAFSEMARAIRRTLKASYWSFAVLLVPLLLWEKVGRQGLIATVAILLVCLIFQHFWMRLFRRNA